MVKNDLVALSEVSFFQRIDILDLEKFFRGRECRISHFEAGQFPGTQGDSYESLLILLRGSAAASMAAPNGKVVRLESLSAPCAVATAVLFSTQNALPVTLEALEPLDCLYIRKDTVLELMREYPLFLEGYLRENGDRLLFLAEKIRLFNFRSLRQKIISHILIQADRQRSDSVTLVYSREEMAQLMGVARPSLSREFSSLVKEGLISTKGRNVTIPDRMKLVQLMKKE